MIVVDAAWSVCGYLARWDCATSAIMSPLF
jgi:hypothetical protein